MLRRKGWDLKTEPIILKEEINDNDANSNNGRVDLLHFIL